MFSVCLLWRGERPGLVQLTVPVAKEHWQPLCKQTASAASLVRLWTLLRSKPARVRVKISLLDFISVSLHPFPLTVVSLTLLNQQAGLAEYFSTMIIHALTACLRCHWVYYHLVACDLHMTYCNPTVLIVCYYEDCHIVIKKCASLSVGAKTPSIASFDSSVNYKRLYKLQPGWNRTIKITCGSTRAEFFRDVSLISLKRHQ